MCRDDVFHPDLEWGKKMELKIARFLNAEVVNDTKDYDLIFRGLRLEIKSHAGMRNGFKYFTFPAETSNRDGDISNYLIKGSQGVYDIVGNYDESVSVLHLFKADMFAEYVLSQKHKEKWNSESSAKCVLLTWQCKEAGYFKSIKIK